MISRVDLSQKPAYINLALHLNAQSVQNDGIWYYLSESAELSAPHVIYRIAIVAVVFPRNSNSVIVRKVRNSFREESDSQIK